MILKILKYNLLVLCIISISSCSSTKDDPATINTPGPQSLIDSETFDPIEGTPPLPLIFSGDFIVDGKPGPSGINIFAQIIDGGSVVSVTSRGLYQHVIVSPVSVRDIEHGFFHFYIGSREGDYVEAKETYPIKSIETPTNVTLNLNFSRLPND